MKALSAKWVLLIVLSFMAFLVLMNTTVYGQGKKMQKHKRHTKHTAKSPAQWPNAQYNNRIYYPDYYTFYDPARHGYVYWQENKWMVSEERPVFMRDADAGKTRIQLLKDDQLAMPEDRFEQYMRLYPAQPVSPSVPVPIITISRDK